MSYTTEQLSYDALYKLAYAQAVDDAQKAFDLAFQGTPTMVEYVKTLSFNGPTKVAHQSTIEAIFDELEYTEVRNSFMDVLKDSKCPFVTELKAKIVSSYISNWTDEVAQFRAES